MKVKSLIIFLNLKKSGILVVRTPHFQCRVTEVRSLLWGTKILHPVGCGQKKKKRKSTISHNQVNFVLQRKNNCLKYFSAIFLNVFSSSTKFVLGFRMNLIAFSVTTFYEPFHWMSLSLLLFEKLIFPILSLMFHNFSSSRRLKGYIRIFRKI